MEFSWQIKPNDPVAVSLLSKELGISPVTATVLHARGITTLEQAEHFLDPGPGSLHSPWLLPDMEKAVERLERARANGEKILIHGDYDVDGITSTALLFKGLSALGLTCESFIPNRLEDDYGFNSEGIESARRVGATLVVTCDCGTTSIEQVKLASEQGIDVIITDHHVQSTDLPPASAVVNPNRLDSQYPFSGLAGVGVAAKFLQAAGERMGKELWGPNMMRIVSIGTVADIMPLIDENRYIVKTGLESMHGSNSAGIKELIRQCGLSKKKKLAASDIGYKIGPRINAAGRLGKHEKALELLLTDNKSKAFGLARKLDDLNHERQQIVMRTCSMANQLLGTTAPDERIIVLGAPGWHQGVLGLVASDLAKTYHRPALVYTIEDGLAVGSARSISGVHILDLMAESSKYFIRYGGHAQAAGFQLKASELPEWKEELHGIAREHISQEQLKRTYKVDAEIGLADITIEFLEELSQLEPFGHGNPAPVFLLKNLEVSRAPMLIKEIHLKLFVEDGTQNHKGEILFWNGAGRIDEFGKGKRIDCVVTLGISEWRGVRHPQITLLNSMPSS